MSDKMSVSRLVPICNNCKGNGFVIQAIIFDGGVYNKYVTQCSNCEKRGYLEGCLECVDLPVEARDLLKENGVLICDHRE